MQKFKQLLSTGLLQLRVTNCTKFFTWKPHFYAMSTPDGIRQSFNAEWLSIQLMIYFTN